MKTYNIEITQRYCISDSQISNILVTAFEGGINYWCPQVRGFSGVKEETYYGYPSDIFETYPDTGFIQVAVEDMDRDAYTLTLENILKAIKRYLKEGLLQYGTEIDEIDAAEADIIVQYALFDELVYG